MAALKSIANSLTILTIEAKQLFELTVDYPFNEKRRAPYVTSS